MAYAVPVATLVLKENVAEPASAGVTLTASPPLLRRTSPVPSRPVTVPEIVNVGVGGEASSTTGGVEESLVTIGGVEESPPLLVESNPASMPVAPSVVESPHPCDVAVTPHRNVSNPPSCKTRRERIEPEYCDAAPRVSSD
jgi:hypothetical protein